MASLKNNFAETYVTGSAHAFHLWQDKEEGGKKVAYGATVTPQAGDIPNVDTSSSGLFLSLGQRAVLVFYVCLKKTNLNLI